MMPPFENLQMYLLCFLGQIGGWAKNEVLKNAQVINVTCIPLYTILLAIGNPTVDFFSLDVEGAELERLKTIPWREVRIKASLHQSIYMPNRVNQKRLAEKYSFQMQNYDNAPCRDWDSLDNGVE